MVLDSLLVAARLLQFASILVLFGMSLFLLYGIEANAADAPLGSWAWPRRLLWVAVSAAFLASIGWLIAETAAVTGHPALPIDWAGLHSVVAETRFGAITFGRIVLLAVSMAALVAMPASRGLWGIEAALGTVLAVSFVGTGHGTLGEGAGRWLHAGGDALHLLAAGVWIGALVPLAILLGRSSRAEALESPQRAAVGLERFSGVGAAAVAVLVLTGLVNSAYLIGASRWRELFTTAYGRVLIVKLALFAAMLALAALNRYRLSPRLRTASQGSVSTATALRAFRRTVLIETGLAFAVLGLVALLGMLEPPVSGSS